MGAYSDTPDASLDIVQKGAFERTLREARVKGRLPAMLWQHDILRPIGTWTEMREDSYGLFVKGQLTLGAVDGRSAYELVKNGSMTGLSIGYRTVRSGAWTASDGTKVRLLLDVDLLEVSPVVFPACDPARISAVKSGAPTDDDAYHLRAAARTLRERWTTA